MHPKLQDETGKFLRIDPNDLIPVLEAMPIKSHRYVCSSLVVRLSEDTYQTWYQDRTIYSAIKALADGHNCMLLDGE